MPLACLLVPQLALACEIAARPGLAGTPVAVTDEEGLHIAEASEQSTVRGVRPGQTVREAVAYCPTLAVLEPHPARVRAAAEAMVEAMALVSPLVEEGKAGVVYADLRGLEGLYPDRDALARAMLDAAPPRLQPRLGIVEDAAGGRFTAYAAAQSAAPAAAVHVAAQQAADFLAPRPIEWLPRAGLLTDTERAWLVLLGVTTLGELAALPRHAVEAQLGARGGRAWLAARGEDGTPLRPRPFHERVIETAEAEPPLVSREPVLRSAEQLLGRALRHRRVQRRFVRVVQLRAETEDDRIWERTQVMKEPTGDRRRLWTAIRPHLEQADYPGPIARLSLALGGLTAESGRQAGMFVERARRQSQLDEMVRHLKLRYGQSPVLRLVTVEPWSRIPERRHALMDYDP